ncbi:MAG TPA: addiction module protein [Pirellulales bacterium]|nr:addiction module protein [Pirellulales bacterium]
MARSKNNSTGRAEPWEDTLNGKGRKDMMERERIAEEALRLSPEDRLYLADRLEQSLPHAGFASPELAQASATEVTRRLDAYDSGESKAVDFDAAIEGIRRRLAGLRDRPDAM